MQTETDVRPTTPLLPRATIDSVSVDSAGDFRLTGWLVAGVPVVAVQLVVNGVSWGSGTYGLPRPDIGALLPHYPRATSSGFAFFRSGVPAVPTALELHVVFENGALARIGVATTAASGASPAPDQAPAILLTVDEAKLDLEGQLRVKGWAYAHDGIERLEVFGPDGLLGIGVPSISRPDVLAAHPSVVTTETTGFQLDLELADHARGGSHSRDDLRLDVRAVTSRGDALEKTVRPTRVERLERKPVSPAGKTAPAAHEDIKLHIDKPESREGAALQVIRDRVSVEGWAVAREGITAVEVYFDDRLIGEAHRGIRRPDVERAYPEWPDSLRAGFSLTVPLRAMADGDHYIRLVAIDGLGQRFAVELRVQVDTAGADAAKWGLRMKVPHAETLALLSRVGVDRPEFVVVMSIQDKGAVGLARDSLRNLRSQTYDRWRVVLAHGLPGRQTSELKQLVGSLPPDLGDRIQVNRIRDLATKASMDHATGWIVTLQPGDLMAADALMQLALAARKTDSDFLYGDERRYDDRAAAVRPFFKPGWSPETLLATNYVGSTIAIPAELARRCFSTVADLIGTSPFDRALRLTEVAERPTRVARLLVERSRLNAEPAASEHAALVAAMSRRGDRAQVKPGRVPGTFRVQRKLRHPGRVSIIIPTIAADGLVKRCVDSIRTLSTYTNYEILILDNIRGESPEWKAWFAQAADRVLFIDEAFNWSRFNNIGREHATGDYLLFLNDDTEVTAPGWLEAMLEHAQRDDVGVVGPKLLYPDGRVQHAGMFLARGNTARHAFRFFEGDDAGYFGLAMTTRNVIAVTGACMLMRAEVFDALGGFDESHDVINNDVDFCLRCHESSLSTIFTPFASLTHHEDVSRASIADTFDNREFSKRWGLLFAEGDPFFNPNLSMDSDGFDKESEPIEEIYAGYPVVDRERIRRVLVVKLDHIGDFVTALPAVRKLKQVFPHASLSALVGPAVVSLAQSVGLFDKVHSFSFFHAKSGLGMVDVRESEYEQLLARLAPEYFDLAIDLRKATDTREVLKYTSATWTAGFDRDQLFPWLDISLQWEGDPRLSHKQAHVAEDLLNLVSSVENSLRTDRRVLGDEVGSGPLPAAVQKLARALYARPVVCVHPASGNALRQWPAAYFSRLIDLLVLHLDVHVAVIGGPGEEDLAQSVLQGVTVAQGVWSLVNGFKLHELPAVLRSCVLFVGNNSGPKHVAAGLGVPTVAVHSAVVSTEEWGPLGSDAMALRRRMECSPCYLATPDLCARGAACLTTIEPWHVFEACRSAIRARVPV